MKYYRQTLYLLYGLLLVIVGLLVHLLYASGAENQEKNKLTAEILLKDAAVALVSQTFPRLGMPFSSGGGNNEVESFQRRKVTSSGPLIVDVDSVKEKKRLLSSDLLASMAGYLFVPGASPVDELNKQWQERLNAGLPYYYSALELIPQMPNNEKNLQQTVSGDSTLCLPKNKLGEYYLDILYFFEVKAYLSAPSVWRCAHWGRMDIVLCIGGVIVGICIIVFLLIYNRIRIPDRVETLPSDSVIQSDEVLSSDIIVSEDKVVCCVANGIYRIGGILFDETRMTITFRSQVKDCPKQPYKLLSAFIHAEGHFLSNNRIVEVCGWNFTDIGVAGKRKTAISQLRRLLKSNESCVNIVSMRNEKGEDGFILLIED